MKSKPFKIKLSNNPYHKKYIIQIRPDLDFIILKIYDEVWWRKLLIKLKIIKNSYLCKVKQLKHDK